MTGQTLVTLALQEIGVLGSAETADANDAEDARQRLNLLIDELFLDRQWLHRVTRVEKTLTAATASYTIGSGGSINTVRPIWIDSAFLVLDTSASPETEIPIEVFTDQRWQAIAQKDLTSRLVQGIYYDHNWSAGLGVVYVWPVPTVSTTQLVLNVPGTSVTEFADLTTDYTFAPGYKSALVANLAKRLCRLFGAPLPPELQEWAVESVARVKRANTRIPELRGERILPGGGGAYNIFTGGSR